MKKSQKLKKIEMPKNFSEEAKGLVICYIGSGKGKTTAAMGVAIRASGAGMNVYILQFVKAANKSADKIKEGEWPLSSEIEFLNFFDDMYHPPLTPPIKRGEWAHSLPPVGRDREGAVGRIENEQLGVGFVGILGDKKVKAAHIKAALDGLNRAKEIIYSGKYQVVILDEILSAVEVDVLTENDVVEVLKNKPKDLHIVITGHNKFVKVLKLCDLVTEMKMIKHPYYKGILAQKGIDY